MPFNEGFINPIDMEQKPMDELIDVRDLLHGDLNFAELFKEEDTNVFGEVDENDFV